MPKYSYKCEECGATFEYLTFESYENSENAECPNCSANGKRIWGGGSFTIFGCPNTKG